eukprot:6204921-Pleurochrysis_carterae.AAC.2
MARRAAHATQLLRGAAKPAQRGATPLTRKSAPQRSGEESCADVHAIAVPAMDVVYEQRECGDDCTLHLVRRPCKRRGLLRLPRMPGCWARAPMGCESKTMPSSLQTRNWTQQPARSMAACLGKLQPRLEAACLPQQDVSLRKYLLVAHVARPAINRCFVTQRALPFQVPRPGTCFSAAHRVSGQRYHINHGHQAEMLVPMLEASVLHAHAPSTLYWPVNMTHWIRSVLPAMWPFTRVQLSAAPRRQCRVFSPVGSGGGRSNWLRTPIATTLLRRAMLRHCGRSEVRVLQHHHVRVAVALLRDNSSSEPRHIAHLESLLMALRGALPTAAVHVRHTRSDAPICEQAAWVYDAGLLLSPHGAHLTNALWLSEGALLLEVMPWGMWGYRGYQGLLRSAGLAYERLNSTRPHALEPQWRNAANDSVADEASCERIEACRRFYRGNSKLAVSVSELCLALSRQLRYADHAACQRAVSDRGSRQGFHDGYL